MSEQKKILIDKKKLQSRIKKIVDLIVKGNNKEGISGSNSVLEKIFYALKDQPKVPLDKVNIDMFGEYGYLRADNFYIGKNKDNFFLFKAKEIQVIPKETKSKLEKTIKTLSKKVLTAKEKNQVVDEIKFAEWKPLSKSDIVERLYQESKSSPELAKEVSSFIGKEKLLKADYKELSFGDIQYMLSSKEDTLKNTKIYKTVNAYIFQSSDTEIRLARNADLKSISTDELLVYAKEIDEVENRVFSEIKLIELLNNEPSSPQKSQKVSQATIELLSCRDRLQEIDKKLQGSFTEKELSQISKEITEDDEINFVQKDSLGANPTITVDDMKLGLKRSNEMLDYFMNEGLEVANQIGIEVKTEVEVRNYGVFKETNPKNALENLLLYAKSLNEMVQNDKKEMEKLQNYDGNFAI